MQPFEGGQLGGGMLRLLHALRCRQACKHKKMHCVRKFGTGMRWLRPAVQLLMRHQHRPRASGHMHRRTLTCEVLQRIYCCQASARRRAALQRRRQLVSRRGATAAAAGAASPAAALAEPVLRSLAGGSREAPQLRGALPVSAAAGVGPCSRLQPRLSLPFPALQGHEQAGLLPRGLKGLQKLAAPSQAVIKVREGHELGALRMGGRASLPMLLPCRLQLACGRGSRRGGARRVAAGREQRLTPRLELLAR